MWAFYWKLSKKRNSNVESVLVRKTHVIRMIYWKKDIKFSNILRRVFESQSRPIRSLDRACMKVHLKTYQYGKTASKKINLSSISCCVLCKGENAYLVYKNETTQFQHQEKPFECRNCPRGYFLRKVFIPMLDSNFLF